MAKKKKLPDILKQIKNYRPLEINYAFNKTVSYSQMSIFLSCPKRWELQYKEGIKPFTSTIYTVFGTAIHETVQNYIHTMYTESGVNADMIDLEEYFEGRFKEVYVKEYQNNQNIHFSSPEEMREFYDDGIAILEFIKNRRREYFTSRGWHLVGIEFPIVYIPNKKYNNVIFNGFVDLIMYNEESNTFVIYDIKTSRQSWSDNQKKDKIKQAQILLYKSFFSEQFGVPEDNIDVEFFILKRKIWENSEYPQKRIQQFSPPSGKTSISKSRKTLDSFIEEAFNIDGTYRDKSHLATPSKDNCKYCPFSKAKDICNVGM